MLTRKQMDASLVLPTAIDALPFDFTENKSQVERVASVAEWLRGVIKKGAIDFHQSKDGDRVILVAFAEVVPESLVNKINDVNWDAYFSND